MGRVFKKASFTNPQLAGSLKHGRYVFTETWCTFIRDENEITLSEQMEDMLFSDENLSLK